MQPLEVQALLEVDKGPLPLYRQSILAGTTRLVLSTPDQGQWLAKGQAAQLLTSQSPLLEDFASTHGMRHLPHLSELDLSGAVLVRALSCAFLLRSPMCSRLTHLSLPPLPSWDDHTS